MGWSDHLDEIWVERIIKSIAGMKYGHVQITIHDGRIVQIDRCERQRFEPHSISSASPDARTNKNRPASG